MVSFLSIFAQINSMLFVLCVCPFTVNRTRNRLHTNYHHILYVTIVLLIYQTVLWFVMYSELLVFDFANYTMTELLLNFSAVSMAFCFSIIVFAGLQSRCDQMRLIQSLVDLDRELADGQSALYMVCGKLCRQFRRQLIGIAIYKLLSLLATILLLADTLSRGLFFACYTISDCTFTVYVNYMAFCGRMVVLRYEIFVKRFQAAMERSTIEQSQYTRLMKNLNALFQMKERLYRAFGSMILFTMFYHCFTLAIAVYGIIITLNRSDDFLAILIMLLLYCLWTLPYFGRVFVLGHVYDAFGLQVIFSIYELPNSIPIRTQYIYINRSSQRLCVCASIVFFCLI